MEVEQGLQLAAHAQLMAVADRSLCNSREPLPEVAILWSSAVGRSV